MNLHFQITLVKYLRWYLRICYKLLKWMGIEQNYFESCAWNIRVSLMKANFQQQKPKSLINCSLRHCRVTHPPQTIPVASGFSFYSYWDIEENTGSTPCSCTDVQQQILKEKFHRITTSQNGWSLKGRLEVICSTSPTQVRPSTASCPSPCYVAYGEGWGTQRLCFLNLHWQVF